MLPAVDYMSKVAHLADISVNRQGGEIAQLTSFYTVQSCTEGMKMTPDPIVLMSDD